MTVKNKITPKIIPEKIQILDVRLISGNIDGNANFKKGSIPRFRTQFNVNHGFNRDEKICKILLVSSIQAMKTKEEVIDISASYTIETTFKIKNFEDFVVLDKNKPNSYFVHSVLGSTLMGIAYSTARGIIFSRTQGTIMEGVILPVINPTTLILNLKLDSI